MVEDYRRYGIELLCNVTIGSASVVHVDYCHLILVLEIACAFAECWLYQGAVNSVSPSPIAKWAIAMLNCVSNILLLCPIVEMRGIDASRIVACVADIILWLLVIM